MLDTFGGILLIAAVLGILGAIYKVNRDVRSGSSAEDQCQRTALRAGFPGYAITHEGYCYGTTTSTAHRLRR